MSPGRRRGNEDENEDELIQQELMQVADFVRHSTSSQVLRFDKAWLLSKGLVLGKSLASVAVEGMLVRTEGQEQEQVILTEPVREVFFYEKDRLVRVSIGV